MSISNEIHFQASNSKVSLFTYNWAEKVITCLKITNYTLISHSPELLKYDTALLCLPVTTVGIILYINIKKKQKHNTFTILSKFIWQQPLAADNLQYLLSVKHLKYSIKYVHFPWNFRQSPAVLVHSKYMTLLLSAKQSHILCDGGEQLTDSDKI